jgi:uncharacterized protein (UPF0335 family)
MTQERMTPSATAPYEAYIANGWTDELLIAHGFLEPAPVTSFAAVETDDRLRLLIERIERLEEEKKGISDDIRDVKAEAKAVGYDPKIIGQIVKLRRMKPDDRREMEMLVETYKNALGIQ